MELTLESALSPAGMLGHLSYLLLVISMVMQRMVWLRIFAIGSAIIGIYYSIRVLNDPVSSFWETTLLTVNLVQLSILYWRNTSARFSALELSFIEEKFPGLSRAQSRKLLDNGGWKVVERGTWLTHQGQPVGKLIYINAGSIDIMLGDKRVSQCGTGDFIGEMSVLNGTTASASAIVVSENAQVWQIERSALMALIAKDKSVIRELEATFARNYREKICQTNHLIAAGLLP